jgi:pimeloyl-ACP methyl ester carboxylesterase
MARRLQVPGPRDRTLEVELSGPDDGQVVVFHTGSITRPVSIWQGRDDRFVPVAHGEWLARHVPGARVQLRDGEGHLSITVGSYAEILDDLIASAG